MTCVMERLIAALTERVNALQHRYKKASKETYQWQPLVIDLSDTRETISAKIKTAWNGPERLRPLFLVQIPPPLLTLLRSAVANTHRNITCTSMGISRSAYENTSVDFEGDEGAQLRREMEEFSLQLLSIFLDDAKDVSRFQPLPDSRLSLRTYPYDGKRKLGICAESVLAAVFDGILTFRGALRR